LVLQGKSFKSGGLRRISKVLSRLDASGRASTLPAIMRLADAGDGAWRTA
jgi:hypothetical protein